MNEQSVATPVLNWDGIIDSRMHSFEFNITFNRWKVLLLFYYNNFQHHYQYPILHVVQHIEISFVLFLSHTLNGKDRIGILSLSKAMKKIMLYNLCIYKMVISTAKLTLDNFMSWLLMWQNIKNDLSIR